MQIFLENKYQVFLSSHPRFQEKNLLKVRIELSKEILELDIDEDRRSYLLHQLAYAHSVEDLSELLARVKS